MTRFLLLLISLLPLSCVAQEGLKYSKAVYVQISSEGSSNFIAKEENIIVPPGKVWEITTAKAYMTYDNRIIGDRTYLYLDDQIISYSNNAHAQHSSPIWLPSGNYRLTIRTEDKNQKEGRFHYNAFITGVEYTIP